MACGDVVLVVDDDPGIVEIVSLILESSGYQVLTATDGAEALGRLRDARERVGLILLDMMMPNVDGWQFRQSQRASHLDGTPVVVLTGDGHASEKAESVGASEFLRKPVELDQLLEAVKRYV